MGYRSADLIIVTDVSFFLGGGGGGVLHNMQKYHHGMTVTYFTDLVQL